MSCEMAIQVQRKGQVSGTMSMEPKDQAEADLPSPQPEHPKDIPTTALFCDVLSGPDTQWIDLIFNGRGECHIK